MAGLLDTIAKRLLGSPSKSTTTTRPVTKTASSTTVKVKPVATQTADEWVKNSTIEEPVVVEPVVSDESTEQVDVSVSEITEIDLTMKRERTNIEVEKDDYLLTQIDEFREKAQKLQSLLLTKESKVLELQTIVEEREGKAKELESILDEHQRKADGITEEVSKQIENLIDKVTSKMEQIGVSLGRELQDGQRLGGQQIEDLKNTLASLNGQQMEDLKETLGSMNEQQAEELKNALASLNAQLEVVKTELSEKVHSENVKCYRNVADLLKMMEDRLEVISKVEENIDNKTKTIKSCSIALIVLTVINLLGIVAVILMELGIFKIFM